MIAAQLRRKVLEYPPYEHSAGSLEGKIINSSWEGGCNDYKCWKQVFVVKSIEICQHIWRWGGIGSGVWELAM